MIFKRRTAGLISDFSFTLPDCLIKAQELNLPYYQPITRGRKDGFMPFTRTLVQSEMQSVLSWIELRLPISFLTAITIMLRKPPDVQYKGYAKLYFYIMYIRLAKPNPNPFV